MKPASLIGVSAVLALCLACPRMLRAEDKGVTDAQAKALGQRMEKAVSQRDIAAASALLDNDALLDRITAGVQAPADFEKGFRQNAGGAGADLLKGIIKSTTDPAAYHFLRVRHVDGQTRDLFRLLSSGGVNYHDWVVAPDAGGEPKFVDAYIALAGEMISQTMRRLYVAGAVQANPTFLDRLRGSDKTYAANFSKIVDATRAMQAGKYAETLQIYHALPQAMRDDKTLMLMRVSVAQKVAQSQPEEYQSAMADFQRLFPTDPAVNMVGLDALIKAGKYPEARQSLEQVEAFTGPDAYLGFLRGNLYVMEGGPANLARAKQNYRKAIDIEPTLANPYWGLVTVSLQTKQFAETAAMLNEIEKKLPLKIGNLENNTLYAEFVKSDAYKKWKASRP